jgi:hypothetical protein
MRRVASSWALIVCSLVIASAGFAQQASITAVPNLIRFGGTLKDAQGAPLASSTVGLTFAIYKQQDGGAAVWMETQSVATDGGGNYSALLGSTTAAGLPGDLFSQQEQRWLGVQVQGQAEEPRVLLVSVPYAFKAHEAETLGGKSVSDFVLVNGASSSANGTSTTQTGPNTANSLPASCGSHQKGRSQCWADELQRLDHRPDCRRHTDWYRSGSHSLGSPRRVWWEPRPRPPARRLAWKAGRQAQADMEFMAM